MNKMKVILTLLIIGNVYIILFNFAAFLNGNLKKMLHLNTNISDIMTQ